MNRWRMMLKHITLLPDEYQEVEYIQPHNGASISFGVVAENNIGLELDIQLLSLNNNISIFGDSGSNARFGLSEYPSGKYCPQFGTWHQTTAPIILYQWQNIKLNYYNDGKFLLDGVEYGSYTNVFSGSDIVTETPSNRVLRFHRIALTRDVAVIVNSIPCYRKSDNEVGLFDVMGNRFLTNNASGYFEAGPDV